jgi:hypothetical protein
MNQIQIKDSVAMIKRTVETDTGGTSKPESIAAIEQQCLLIEQAGAAQGRFATHLAEIRQHTEDLYSVRKHHQWDSPACPGTQQLVVWILRAADGIAIRADKLEG